MMMLNWAKKEKLEKVGDVFEKTVTLPDSSDKILYKVRSSGRGSSLFFCSVFSFPTGIFVGDSASCCCCVA